MIESLLQGILLMLKSQQVLSRVSWLVLSLKNLIQRDDYATAASAEDVAECGGLCPVCHESLSDLAAASTVSTAAPPPVRLRGCNHIFCRDCLEQWLLRQSSCPLCRAAVGRASSQVRSFGDGGSCLLPSLY